MGHRIERRGSQAIDSELPALQERDPSLNKLTETDRGVNEHNFLNESTQDKMMFQTPNTRNSTIRKVKGTGKILKTNFSNTTGSNKTLLVHKIDSTMKNFEPIGRSFSKKKNTTMRSQQA